MGIKQTITKDKLPLKYQAYNLIETTDGISHSVYLLDDKYVLKIVEKNELSSLLNEQILLKEIEKLSVPKLLNIVQNEDTVLAFYSQIKGTSINKPTLSHIEQIALFLKSFHHISKNLKSSNDKIYDKEYLKGLVIKTNNPTLLNYFNDIQCELKNDGIIHGDLFYDNAKFNNNILSGVFDFIEACEGDFTFELAVVAISWCFDKDSIDIRKINTLLDTYELNISYKEFLEYIKYALLYYITTRYLSNRDYKELLIKLESL